AAGVFLRGMQHHAGWDVHGVEINSETARLARERYQLEVRTGTLEQAAYSDGLFDVVTMWGVLEHLHDPAGSLREVHRVLNADGVLVVRVPNLASCDARLFGKYWAGFDSPRHLFVFTPRSLTSLLECNGFRVQNQHSRSGGAVMFQLSLRFWL